MKPSEYHPRNLKDAVLISALDRDINANRHEVANLHIDLPVLLVLAQQVQIALKNPDNKGAAANCAREFIDQTQQMFRERGLKSFVEALDEGWKHV